MDFETGTFANWVCRAGTVNIDPSTGLNAVTWTSVGPPVNNLHTIMSYTSGGTDIYGNFPQTCPNGSGYSAKIGNATASLSGGVGREASGVSYTYNIPAATSNFSILFQYAVVLENPNPPHTQEAQPRFRATIRDLTTGASLPCVTFDFIVSSSLGGFFPSAINPNVYYRPWTPVTLNLSGLAGRTIEVEFIATECTQNGHWAYAYVDVNSNCNGAIQGSTICQGDNSITLTAPFGFQSYQWFSDATFTTLLSTTQTLPLNPAPTVGTIIPVIVDPFPGFGCRDTLYATITVSPKPVSVAGSDTRVCENASLQIGGPPTAGYNYEWTPVSNVSNPIISNPTAWVIPPGPTEFIVKTTDVLTGCFSYDTMYLGTTVVDTSLAISGAVDFCNGFPGATLTVNSLMSPIQWYDGGSLIPGATSPSYTPTTSGNYWAEITQGTCIDTTRVVPVIVYPIPTPLFTVNDDTLCITSNVFQFTNNSTISDNSTLTHTWKFSDGTTQQTLNATKSFSPVGSYTAELVTQSAFGCKDSTRTTVWVLPNGVPAFEWDTVCLDRPVLFRNNSNENSSVFVQYNWDFGDGGTGSTIKNPPPVTYSTTGWKDVTLTITTLGCENDPVSLTRSLKVNRPDDGIRYRTITVPEGTTRWIHVRDTIGRIYNWRPPIQLTSYTTAYTEFIATASGVDVEYLIDITDENTCITTDTVFMQILKKPGFYLPTAFTPNDDGLNDVVKPYIIGMKAFKSFSVFNRWGNLIFRSSTYGEGWDGKYKGVTQDPGVYVWILEFVDSNDKKVTEKGNLTIIR